jgi:methionine-rich copper-binding protein CopC
MLRNRLLLTSAAVLAAALCGPASLALAHVRPQTTSPTAGARLDASPAQITLNYDGVYVPNGSSVSVLDGTGAPVPTAQDPPASSPRATTLHPASDLPPGPYTVDWTTVDSQDGHEAQGFYTFVVNGGPAGIVNGMAQQQKPAADLQSTLTVSNKEDGASMLRVDLNNTTGVERVRIRLSRPDLGEDLLDTQPSGDGGWILSGDEVALPGTWHADTIVRRTNIFDDAQAGFDFTIDPTTGEPTFL